MNAVAVALEAQGARESTPRAERLVRAAERALDRVFGAHANPLRRLGALATWLLGWVLVSGLYVYVFYETSVDGAYRSVQALGEVQPWAGGLMRSLHRYASDALVIVTALHVAREWMLGRFRDFRAYSWCSGVPLPWLLVASGLVGYWMVWDQRALYVGTSALEWVGALPGVGSAAVRNFVDASALTDRLFSLLSFLHIGVPLLLLAALWAHVLRLARPAVLPGRSLAVGLSAALLALSIVLPATSMAPADLSQAPQRIELDWFYLGVLPLADRAPLATWALLAAGTALLLGLPWLRRPGRAAAKPAAAVVDPARCNGCSLCVADCPYEAVVMAPHANGRPGVRMAVVDAGRCAACGICAGACPSATPFRRGAPFATGIDLPQRPLAALRAELDTALDRLEAAPSPRVVVLGCTHGARLASAPVEPGTAMLAAPCTAQWPPVFIEYALRRGADGVLLTGCPPDDCAWRLGARWTAERLAGRRQPWPRAQVPRERVRLHWAAREDAAELAHAVRRFRAALAHAHAQAEAEAGTTSRPHADEPEARDA